MLRMLLTEHENVPWQALRYLTAEVTYGGRVTDTWDKRCIINVVEKFYAPETLDDGYCYSSSKVIIVYCIRNSACFRVLRSSFWCTRGVGTARKTIKGARKKLKRARKKLKRTRKKLKRTRKTIKGARKKLKRARKQLKGTRKKLKVARKKLNLELL